MSARPSTDVAAADLFRRHVRRAAEHVALARQRRTWSASRSPKSSSFTVPSVQEEHVGRLDVAMDDALLVRVMQRVAQLRDDVRACRRASAAAARPSGRRGLVPRRNSITMYGVLPSSANSKTVTMLRVLQLGGGARLAIEARAHLLGVFGEVDEHQLDRDFAVEHRVDAAVAAHPCRPCRRARGSGSVRSGRGRSSCSRSPH